MCIQSVDWSQDKERARWSYSIDVVCPTSFENSLHICPLILKVQSKHGMNIDFYWLGDRSQGTKRTEVEASRIR